jgi:anthranilate/para-aminobenzoate synthase component I
VRLGRGQATRRASAQGVGFNGAESAGAARTNIAATASPCEERSVYALRLQQPGDLEVIASALPARGRFWLDGHAPHPEGRWAFLGAEPLETRLARFGESALALLELPEAEASPLEGDAGDLRSAIVPHWVACIAYDAAWSEPARLGLREEPRLERGAMPVVWLGRYERMFAADLERREVYALGPDRAACEELAEAARHGAGRAGRGTVTDVACEDPGAHRRAIEHALDAISEGRIYQVNLARRWSAQLDGEPLALFLAMRRASPVPFGFYLELPEAEGGGAVLARTMERFLRWERRGRRLETCPIKGTIARHGADDDEARALRADSKEQAEHAMIVDLMRNDLSRVAEVGTVRVEGAMRVEPYAGLSHLVSTVACLTRPEVGPRAILEATFPPGSITGAPKLAAMELIEREERVARGVYTGAVGHVDREGGLSLAVAIRTATVNRAEVAYFAGGGLVEASDPAREVAETELKARVFLDACASLGQERGAAG